jgi:pilus assembly protein CpaC
MINMIVAPEVSSIDRSASITIGNLSIPGLSTRRAKTVVELRDGESFALAGLLRNEFSDTIRQFPGLGRIPIIGTLFRSTNFQREETELVIIVTPRLVRPVRAGSLKVPTDRVREPHETELLLLGRTDTGVPVEGMPFLKPAPAAPPPVPIGAATPVPAPGKPAAPQQAGLERDYGHVL